MTKYEFFLGWLKSRAFTKRVNVFRVFGTNIPERIPYTENPIDKHNGVNNNPNMDDFVLLRDSNKFFTMVGGKRIELGNHDVTMPFIPIHEPITILPQDLPNIDTPTKSYFGMLFINYYCIIDIVGGKFEYLNEHLTGSTGIEERLFAKNRLEKDNPHYLDIKTEINPIRTRIQLLEGFSLLFVPSATIKTTRSPKPIIELRDKLLKERVLEDGSYSATDVAEIKKILAGEYKKYIESDPDYGGMVTAKSWTNTMLGMKVMIGAIERFDKPGFYNIITTSFEEGTKIEDLTTLANTSIAGSYNRGHETQLTGVEFSLLQRVINNMITEDDCGTTEGLPMTLDKIIFKYYIGRYYADNEGVKLITDKDTHLIGKTIRVFTPLLCKSSGVGLCLKCMGKLFDEFKTQTAIMSSEPAGRMSNAMMKSMHKDGVDLFNYDMENELR